MYSEMTEYLPSMTLRGNACLTCRSRKVKCDKTRPVCSACHRLDLECVQQGAVQKLIWLEPGTPNGTMSCRKVEMETSEREVGLRRKPMFTDQERIAECRKITRQVPGRQVENILQQIDQETNTSGGDNALQYGPFGAFALEKAAAISDEVNDLSLLADIPEDDWVGVGSNEQFTRDQSLALKSPLQLPWGGTSPLLLFGENFDDAFNLDMNNNEPSTATDLARLFSPTPRLITSMPLSFAQDIGDLAPTTMRSLLDHYQSSMMSCWTPLQHEKPPWKILHVPCAISAYGEMMLLGNSNNAKTSLLFAILSISAFNMHHLKSSTDESQDWLSIAEVYRVRAKSRLKECLREQGGKQKKAKYKEILMALLSMVSMCVVSGQMQEARCFLLDAERFIYLQSLRKHKGSRKVNMLHSIYLYLRIIEESTFTPAFDNEPFLADFTAPVTEEAQTAICRYPSLWTDRLKANSNLDSQSMVDLETRLVNFPADVDEPTMFEQIYGIPESLFRLLSHTTHLADAVRKSRFSHPNGMSQELAQRTKMLESKICDWKNPYRLLAEKQTLVFYGPAESSERIQIRTELLFDFLEAMHSALIIYFYRRVRDMNAVALQHWVGRTIHHLLEHERKKIKYGDTSAYVCWPAFIAACEALDPTHREQISAFLFRAGQQSGMRMFDAAGDIASTVWSARDSTGNYDISWGDVLATSSAGLIVT